MAKYEILLPKMGESVAEATVTKWEKNIGDWVDIDDILVEVATDKVDSEVPSPVAGKLIEILFNENDVALVGDVLAIIETEVNEENNSESFTQNIGMLNSEEDFTANIEPEENQEENFETTEILEQNIAEISENIKAEPFKFYSPLVKSMAKEEGISLEDLDKIIGSGADNRVTKDDLMEFIKQKNQGKPSVLETLKTINNDVKPKELSVTSKTFISGEDEIIEMDRMRKIIADHMVMSVHTAPHVTSFVEADVTNLVRWRDKVKASFEKREGTKITFTPIFIEAVAKALKDMPMVNVSVNGSQIIKKKNINIGMATALPSGNLIVPVIKNTDQLSLLGLTKAVNDLASRARINKLQPDEVQGGTFTLTNLGAFGNILGTPIINQPQVAILAVGVIKKKPAVLETEFGDVIAIRHMMYLSMSYDHRVVDGALGGAFIKKVADYLEQWDVDREI